MIYSSWDIEREKLNFVTLGHFLPFYPFTKFWKKMKKKFAGDIIIIYMCIKNDNNTIYGSWDMEWDRQSFCNFGPFFALIPTNNQQNQNFNKTKKTSGDIISLHYRTINGNHIMYGSWDTEHTWHKFLSFWTNFCF